MRRCCVATLAICSILLSFFVVPSWSFTSGGFIENRGQVDPRVKYYCPGSQTAVYFTQDAVVIDVKEGVENLPGPMHHQMAHAEMGVQGADSVRRKGRAVYIQFEGANPSPVVEARRELVTKYNYFLGNDTSRWQIEVPVYSEVVYRDVWPAVDLVFREEGGRLVYETVLSSGADMARVRLRHEGVAPVTAIVDGSVQAETPADTLGGLVRGVAREGGALVWPDSDGPSHPLLADNPSALLWSTFLGGSDGDHGSDVVLDASGNAVITGFTHCSDFPTTPGAYDRSYDGGTWDVFVAKISASGSTLVWSTFLGGSGSDEAYSLVLDSSGSPVVTGITYSSDFPTSSGAYDTSHDESSDAFVAKLSASGNALLWSTFLGGCAGDYAYAVALDASGNPVVTGMTSSSDFPTTPGAYDVYYNGHCAFVAKLSASANTLLWSTFLGGSGSPYEAGRALAINSSGCPILTGWTGSSDFPTTAGAYDTSFNGGFCDVFVAKLSDSGSALLWSTFLGGGFLDQGYALALDSLENLVVTGDTGSPDFPTTPGAYDTLYNRPDVFVAKLSDSGSTLLWSTFLGGGGPCATDYGRDVALDLSGDPIVTGHTWCANFPTTPGAYDTSFNGGSEDAFVAKFSASGSDLLWSSFLGSSGQDNACALALQSSGNPVVVGITTAADFPTTPGAYDTSYGVYVDVFVVNLDVCDVASVSDEGHSLGSTMLYPGSPNPFSRSTSVQFCLPRSQPVSVEVYDVQGKLVRTLVDDVAEPGMHRIDWNGETSGGMRAAPGLYFCHMEAGNYRSTKKVVLLR